jgi:hypothetical protein
MPYFGLVDMGFTLGLVKIGPGVTLVQLKDGLQVPCGFSGSAGTITRVTSPSVAKS